VRVPTRRPFVIDVLRAPVAIDEGILIISGTQIASDLSSDVMTQGVASTGISAPFSWSESMSFLWWALVSFVVAAVGGILGFTNVASGASKVGRVLFGTFVLITVVIILLSVIGFGVIV
jgi:uncharacterized membrane protein YtjA (UPF0391 family)